MLKDMSQANFYFRDIAQTTVIDNSTRYQLSNTASGINVKVIRLKLNLFVSSFTI